MAILSRLTSIREYDRNAYRFDGSAFPQYRITYADEDGVVTEREIYVDNWHKRGAVTYYFCWCFERDDRRTFRSDRIIETINVQTGRRIKDISALSCGEFALRGRLSRVRQRSEDAPISALTWDFSNFRLTESQRAMAPAMR